MQDCFAHHEQASALSKQNRMMSSLQLFRFLHPPSPHGKSPTTPKEAGGRWALSKQSAVKKTKCCDMLWHDFEQLSYCHTKRNNVDSLQNISISPQKSLVTFAWKQVTRSLPSSVISDLPGEAKNGRRVLGAGESPQILGDKFVFLLFLPQNWSKMMEVSMRFRGKYPKSKANF